MSKTLRTVAVIAGAVALVATGVGAAAGVGVFGATAGSAAAVAGASTALSASVIATAATVASVASAVGFAASIGAQVTAKKVPARGSVNEVIISNDPPAPYLIGRTYSGGVLRHDVGYGATLKKVPNPYRGQVLVHSVAGPVAALLGIYADYAEVPFSGNAATGYYAGYLYRDVRLGQNPETALTPTFPGLPNWGASYRLSSKAAILLNGKFDKDGKRFASGWPAMGAVWQGVMTYDARKDSSYPGGSGSQRIDDETTWAYSECPAQHALAYALGRFRNGKKVFGVGLPADGIILEHFVELSNVCQANGWTVGGILYEPGDRWANLKRILEAGGAEPLFIGGKLGLRINAPRVSIYDLTASDLAEDDAEIPAAKTWRERRNGIRPKYRSESNKWTYVTSDLVSVPAYISEDGEEKFEELQWDLVQARNQAAQLAAYKLVNGREIGPVTIVCKPHMRRFGAGDLITLNLGADHALGGLDAVILKRSVDPSSMKVTLTLETETAGKHDFALGRTGTAPPTPSLAAVEDKDVIARSVIETDAISWTGIIDDDPARPRPEDGATVGATPAQVSQIALLDQAVVVAQAAIAQAQADISEITGAIEGDFGPIMDAINVLENDVAAVQGNITSLQSATSSINQSVGTLQSDVAAAQQTISAMTVDVSSALTSIDSLQSQADGIIASIGSLGTEIDQVQSTVSTQGGSITSLQQSVTNINGSVSTLLSRVTAGGSLLTNTDLAIDTSGWDFAKDGQAGAIGSRDPAGDPWRIAGEHNIGIYQPNGSGSGYAEWLQSAPVVGGMWYEFSARVAAHRCHAAIIIQWFDSLDSWLNPPTPTHDIIHYPPGGPLLGNWAHVGVKGQAPATAARALLHLRKYGTNVGTTDSYAWFARPMFKESTAEAAFPSPYSPGSARATIETQAQAISTLDGSMASLTTRVSTAESGISQNATAITTATGNLASLTTTVSSQGGSISTLQSSFTGLDGTVSSLSSTVSAQGSSISSLQTAVSTTDGNVATLQTQVSAGGGNLLQNTDIIDLSYWNMGDYGAGAGGRVAASGDWVLRDENALHIAQGDGNSGGYSEWTQWVTIEANKWYDASVLAAAHRCFVEVYLQWYQGDTALYAPSTGQVVGGVGTADIRSWAHLSVKAQAPDNATRARFILRKFGTFAGEANSYAWFCRPQVKETLAGSATPQAYSVGSARGVVEVQAQALSGLGTSLASLTTRVSSAEGSVSTLQSSMTSASGSISTLESNVSSLNGSVSTLQQSSSTQAGQISTLSSTVSTQGGAISQNATAITTLTGSLSTLSTVVRASSSPNLAKNGGFENRLVGWTGHGPVGFAVSTAGGYWGFYAQVQNFTGSAGNANVYLESEDISVPANNPFALSMDFDIQGGGRAYASLVWYDASHGYISGSGSTVVEAPQSFDNSGALRTVLLAPAPVTAAYARVRAVFNANPGETISSGAVRQIKFEMNAIATPYSGEAGAGQIYEAYATLDTSFASLSTTVSSQGGSIGTLQSSFTGLNGTVSTLSSTVSAQGASISSLQTASSTQAGQISTLQTLIIAGGGNTLVNTDAGLDTAGWGFASQNGATFGRNLPDAGWHPANENTLTIVQANATSAGVSDATQVIEVAEDKWYDASAYCASHRCATEVILQWLNEAGGAISAPSSGLFGPYGGGATLASFAVRSFKAQAPAGAVRARFYLRKHGTISGQPDSYAWFLRPQVVETTATSASPVAYSPGSARASISSQATALSTLNSTTASINTTVATQGGSISTLQSSLTTLEGSVSTLSSTVSSQGSSITSLQTAVSTTDGNVATLITTVNAGAPNLLAFGGFEKGKEGWTSDPAWVVSSASDQNWGRFITINATGNSYCSTAAQPAQIGQQYTISCDIDRGGTSGGVVAARMIWLDAGGGIVGIGPVASKASGGFSNSEADRVFGSGTCPAGIASFYVQLAVEGVTGNQYWRRIKVNTGATPARYSDEASIVQSFETLSTLTTQYASLSSAVSTQGVTVSTHSTALTTLNDNVATLFGQYVLAVDVNGVTTGMKLANNGSTTSLKFKSDVVEFTGSTTTQRTEFSGGNWRVYDANGVMRVRMGVW